MASITTKHPTVALLPCCPAPYWLPVLRRSPLEWLWPDRYSDTGVLHSTFPSPPGKTKGDPSVIYICRSHAVTEAKPFNDHVKTSINRDIGSSSKIRSLGKNRFQ